MQKTRESEKRRFTRRGMALCLLFTTCLALLALPACGREDAPSTGMSPTSDNPASGPEAKGATRTLTDLSGEQVVLPAAKDIKRVVVVSPPVLSFVMQVVPDKKSVVGASKYAFANANPTIMEKVFPDYKAIDVTFIDAGFTVNKESLLALKPDVILYYGKVQKKGLGTIDVPCVDFLPKDAKGPEAVSEAWSRQLGEIFGLDDSKGQERAWQHTKDVLGKLAVGGTEAKSALCVYSDVAGTLMVSGKDAPDSYAQSFFSLSGLRNVAQDLDGSANVSMEQIYKWDPDLIVVFQDAPAQDLLDNAVSGQDWSLLKAWKNRAIYDVPRTTFSWISPCADSSLMPLWLVSKAYPEKFSEAQFRKELAGFYERNYSIALTEDDMDSILGGRKASAS